MASKTARPSTSTDLGRLWRAAVRDYKERTGEDLATMGVRNVADVMRQTDAVMIDFKGFRDDGSKKASFRSAMGDHLDGLQTCIDGFAAVGACVSAFPPMMPVGLVFTAASRVISAFAGVRADYDSVEEFFAYSARFFQRLSLLENKAQSDSLAVAVIRVFSMQLSVCARVKQLIKHKRFKQWLNALWNEVDQELIATYAGMQASIQELNETVSFEMYGNLATVQHDVLANNAKLDELDEKLQSYSSNLEGGILQVYESMINLHLVINDVRNTQIEDHALILQIFKSAVKTSKAPEIEEKKKSSQKSKGDISDRKFQALRELKKFFANDYDAFPLWQDAHQENLLQDKELLELKVNKTAGWLREHEKFKDWVDGKVPLLWLRGAEGVGKSFLAYSVVQQLRLRQSEHDCLAYFYFKEEHPYQQSMQNAFASAALQIAGSNNRYAEQVAAKIKQGPIESANMSTWERFFLSMFSSDTETGGRLFLVFDGLDEAHVKEGGTFTQFLSDLNHRNASISVFATSRPDDKPTLQMLQPSLLEVTKHEIRPDMRMLVKDRLRTLPRIRKFTRTTKASITREVVKHADSMLYVEHMLRRFNYIGRERAVSQALKDMPQNLHGLYDLLLEECRHDRSEAQYQAMKKLFAWLAFSKRSLSLGEASSLCQLALSDDTFDIEVEVIGRSSRILELTQSRQLEEDAKDDDKDEDEDDEVKDDGIPELGYGDPPLSFQDRSLRQYFKSVSVEDDGVTEFRTPATAAHLTILQMCVDVMMKAAQDPFEAGSSGLNYYAINYWYEHLKELDADTASPEAVRDVVTLLHCITDNTHNVAKLFEMLARHTEIYPERAEDTSTAWYDTLFSWTARVSTLPDGSLDEKVKLWTLTVDRDNVLLPLAHGHVHNWLDASDSWWIPERFRFAKAALSRSNASGAEDSEQFEPLDYMNAIITRYDIPPADYKTLRAIGGTLSDYGTTFYDDRREILLTEGIVHLKRAVECMKGDVLENIATMRLLALAYRRCDQMPDAIKYYDDAYDMVPNYDADGSAKDEIEKIKFIRIGIMMEKASAYSAIGEVDEAFHAYNEARRLQGEKPLAGTILDDITRLFQNDDETDSRRLMEILKSWTEKERNSFFTYNFEDYVFESTVKRMQKAALLCNETDLLIGWLGSLANILPPESLQLFNIRGAIADIYYPMLGDIENGKRLRQELLALPTKPSLAYEDSMNEARTRHRMHLADILFCEFQMTDEPTKKEAIMNTLRDLPSAHDNDDDSNNVRESHVDMLRANMLRIMGPAKEYERYMKELFQKCVAGLEDSISWNDQSSLRLLAKVLASLDSLEADARIAISAQFSILDLAIYGRDLEPEKSETSSNESDTEAGAEQDPVKGESEPLNDSDVVRNDSLTDEALDVESNDLAGEPIEEKQDPTEPGEQDVAETESKDERESDAETEPDKLDEDVFLAGGLDCDGPCETSITSWTQPIYYCLICPNCDLCEDCHSKRVQQTKGVQPTEGKTEEPWLSFCGANHRYIKGPMKGWKGVKNGVIRYADTEITVTEWLRVLKDERWPNAWKIFWTRQGGLKDIGVED
ncbi:uncharacterized protein J4E79_009972 [Alternaria viburni]|uniref:uncharacterized protein n=1 Tax=Alternaria viburni TaxID=566460 RepID=UPI0020C3DA9F|nr:uncharacterized protein J4E79_009972 [Alternaria viburni]KAI4648350.1 hypothetical protein J4E79_009972 [Alternaria viburni]